MIKKSAIGVRLAIDIIDSIKAVLKALVNSDSVILHFIGPVVGNQCLIQLHLLINFTQLVLATTGLPLALTPLLRFTYNRHAISLLIFSI